MTVKEKIKNIEITIAKKIAKIIDFGVFLTKRVKSDAIFRVAGSLSYTSLLALVPLLAIGLAIFAAFPMFADTKDQLQIFLIHNFFPEMGEEIGEYFNEFISASAKLTTIGVVGIAVTAVLLLSTIEGAFNFIFKVKHHRTIATKVTLYWTVITLGPLLLGAAFSLRGYLYTLKNFVPEHNEATEMILTNAIPTILTIILLVAIYMLVPNKKIKFSHSLVGAIVTVILFTVLRIVFSKIILNSVVYKTLYGAMATVPLLLVWMYMSWSAVLLGAMITAALEEYKNKDIREKNTERQYNSNYNRGNRNHQRRDNKQYRNKY